MLTLLKKIIAVTALLSLPVSASASLISTEFDQVSYLENDIVTMDIFINNANADIAWLEFDLDFDDSQFMFSDFTFTDQVIANTWYSDAFDFIGLSPLTVQVEFADLWQDQLTSSFKLGSATFVAQMDAAPTTTIGYFETTDSNGNVVEAQSAQPVPEPASLAMFALALLFMLLRVKKQA
ncbi:PEP-CTERM sorting domain-containing protein [Thalassotalea sp. PLHSN55]|uniref:PEP-CTERM sorting domain-containing protein n=1 Tax=Thalassotalea sp. PLHSN55 TaxID=3435888 RepID=UPI003F847DB1